MSVVLTWGKTHLKANYFMQQPLLQQTKLFTNYSYKLYTVYLFLVKKDKESSLYYVHLQTKLLLCLLQDCKKRFKNPLFSCCYRLSKFS